MTEISKVKYQPMNILQRHGSWHEPFQPQLGDLLQVCAPEDAEDLHTHEDSDGGRGDDIHDVGHQHVERAQQDPGARHRREQHPLEELHHLFRDQPEPRVARHDHVDVGQEHALDDAADGRHLGGDVGPEHADVELRHTARKAQCAVDARLA